MKKSNVIDLSSRAENADPLTDLILQGARRLIEQAIEALCPQNPFLDSRLALSVLKRDLDR